MHQRNTTIWNSQVSASSRDALTHNPQDFSLPKQNSKDPIQSDSRFEPLDAFVIKVKDNHFDKTITADKRELTAPQMYRSEDINLE